jgi:hypothetical protein
MCRTKIKLSSLIGKMLEIEKNTGIRLDAYYLYDRVAKEKITVQNCERTFEYRQAYNNRSIFDYMFDDEIEKNPLKVLQKCNGHVYVPVCLRNQQKAYIFEFNREDIQRILATQETSVTVVYEQLYLPFS